MKPPARVGRFVRALERAADVTTTVVAIGGLAGLVIFAIFTTLDGLLRGLFGLPIEAVRDIGGYFIAVFVAAAFPRGFYTGANIVISVIDVFVPPAVARLFDIVAAVIVWLLVWVFAERFFLYALDVDKAGEQSPMLQFSLAPFWYCVVILLVLTGLAQTAVLIRTILGPDDQIDETALTEDDAASAL